MEKLIEGKKDGFDYRVFTEIEAMSEAKKNLQALRSEAV